MALDESQQKQVQDWLLSKSPSPICPSCGQLGPYMAGDIIAPFVIKGENREIIMGVTIPMVPVICVNCAFVRLYSAMGMGLIKTDATDKSATESAKE